MEIAHQNEAENDSADAEEFDFVVALNAIGEIICNYAVKFND